MANHISQLKKKLRGGVRGVDYEFYLIMNPIDFLEAMYGSSFSGLMQSLTISTGLFLGIQQAITTLTSFVEGGKESDPTLLCKSIATPACQIEEVTVENKGHTIKMTGKRTYDNVDVTFYNAPDQQFYDFLQAWSLLCSHWNDDGKPVFIQAEGMAMLVQKDATQQIVGGWLYTGIWPQNIAQIDMSADGYDPTDFVATFAVEKAYRLPNMNTFASMRNALESLIKSMALGSTGAFLKVTNIFNGKN